MAGPEEAAQPVPEASRHDVQVNVRDGLADNVVQREEGALCPERSLLSCAHPPAGRQEAAQELLGHLGEGRVMDARHDESVAVEHGPVVQEGHAGLVLEEQVGWELPRSDLVEDAL